MSRISFCLVGGGWRAQFYLRVARALPDLFSVTGILVRDRAKAETIERTWGVRTYRDVEALTKHGEPQFCVTCLPWAANPETILRLVNLGVPVLSETPPAPDVPGLKGLVERVRGSRGLVQVAEEYHLRPLHIAQSEIIRRGLMGAVHHASVSVGHGYHGISLMRRLLGVAFEPARIHSFAFTYPIVQGPGKEGPPTREQVVEEKQELYVFQFPGERVGLVDFAGSQYFGWIRSDRLLVRGDRGQIEWDEVLMLKDFATPLRLRLERVESGRYGNLAAPSLQGFRFGDSWIWRNSYPAPLMDDEIALCEVLSRMGAYVETGAEFYPLAEGAHDHYLYLRAQESADRGSAEVSATPADWGGA